jgi:predicted secreted protein
MIASLLILHIALKFFFPFIKISLLIFTVYACNAAYRQQNVAKPSPKMENSNIETKKIKVSETFTVELASRGYLGLQLLFRTDNDSIVKITRLPPDTTEKKQISPGDPLKAIYEIKGLKPGEVKITFYETQPWNKDFRDIIKKVINLQVVE